ncbi:hypothetical protein DL98DRAFT_529334 [Cadophora sp. DSE1049]|nr:hypothetical protein DL98DRAFT_529334 [Cadophora sp. DSE1049]
MFALPFAPPMAPPLFPPFGPPQQLFGRGLQPRRPLGSPLKSRGGNGRLYIESPGTNSIWPIRQRRLARQMPGLYQKMRESGDKIANPLEYLPCDTVYDHNTNPLVVDLLMNSIAWPYTASPWAFPSPVGGEDFRGYLSRKYMEANQALGIQDLGWVDQTIQEVLELFRRAGNILREDGGCSFGVELYGTILNCARVFVAFIAYVEATYQQHSFDYTCHLIESLFTMTDKDEQTLRMILLAIPVPYRYALAVAASQHWLSEGTFVMQNIAALLTGAQLMQARPR